MQVLRKYRYGNNQKYWVTQLNNAAYAPTFAEFERHLNNILNSLPDSNKFFKDADPKLWANAVFEGDRWGIVNNNIAESWNTWIKEARSMPPLAMVDSIRKQTMEMMCKRRDAGARMTGTLCSAPKVALHAWLCLY